MRGRAANSKRHMSCWGFCLCSRLILCSRLLIAFPEKGPGASEVVFLFSLDAWSLTSKCTLLRTFGLG